MAIRSVVIFTLLSSFIPSISFAQQIPFTPRESIIFNTLNQLQEKEAAIADSIQEAQMKMAEGIVLKNQVKEAVKTSSQTSNQGGFSFKDAAHQIHPYLSTSIQTDDNVYLNPSKKSDSIYSYTPGLKFNSATANSSLNLDVHTNNKYYRHQATNGSGQTVSLSPQATSNTVAQTINNSQDINASILNNISLGRYTLTLSDEYFSNYISTPEAGIKVDNLAFYWKNQIGTSLSRNFNRIGFDIGYLRSDSYYDENNKALGQASESFTFSQYLKIATKTRLLFGYTHSRVTNARNVSQNSNADDYTLSLTNVLSPKISSLTSVDYSLQDNKGTDDLSSLALSATAAYRLSDRSNLSLNLKRSLSMPAKTHENFYNDTTINISGNHRFAFNPRLNFSFLYSADYINYPKSNAFTNEIDTYGYTLGLTYAFKQWFDFGFEFKRTRVNSNYSNDYNDNTFTLRSDARF